MNLPYPEADLLKRAIRNARPRHVAKPRWVVVRELFATGQHSSRDICEALGFDPDQEIQPLERLSDEDYEESLLQHGIVR